MKTQSKKASYVIKLLKFPIYGTCQTCMCILRTIQVVTEEAHLIHRRVKIF
jgi:hypothetical protein